MGYSLRFHCSAVKCWWCTEMCLFQGEVQSNGNMVLGETLRLGQGRWCMVSGQVSTCGEPLPSWEQLGREHPWRRARQRPEWLCLQWMLPGYYRSLLTPGAWDFPNSEEKREWLGANSLNCRPSVATELILWFPQCWKGNPNNSAYYQNFKLKFPNNTQRKTLKNDLNCSLVPSQAPHF